MHFVSNLEKCREYAFLRKYVQIITILHGGGPPNLLQHYIGGCSKFSVIQYYNFGRNMEVLYFFSALNETR